jgi:hypothetical protein
LAKEKSAAGLPVFDPTEAMTEALAILDEANGPCGRRAEVRLTGREAGKCEK